MRENITSGYNIYKKFEKLYKIKEYRNDFCQQNNKLDYKEEY